MIRLHPAQERGHFDHGWLNTYHLASRRVSTHDGRRRGSDQ